MSDNRIYHPYQPLAPVAPQSKPKGVQAGVTANQQTTAGNFSQLLEQEITGVKFSQHALQRLDSRQIQLDNTQLTKLGQAVEKAAQKGAKETLVLLNDNLAFVVSVKNKTVITAMDGASMKENVFTNIDSAVIM